MPHVTRVNAWESRLRVIVRSSDLVLISFVEATLRDEGLDPFVADRFMSAVEGGISAFPQRVLVPSDQWASACRMLEVAGLGAEIVRDGQ